MATFRAVMSHEPLQAPTLLGYLWRVRRALAPGVGLALLRSLAIAPCPLIFAHIIDRSVPAGDSRDVLLATAVFAALLGLHYLFSILGANELAKVMARQMVELRSRIFSGCSISASATSTARKPGACFRNTRSIRKNRVSALHHSQPVPARHSLQRRRPAGPRVS